MAKLLIPKQDTRPPQTLQLEFPAHIAERLNRFAQEGGHSPSYVATFILDGALPPEETPAAKTVPTPKASSHKETPKAA
jgi:hypothetical protein